MKRKQTFLITAFLLIFCSSLVAQPNTIEAESFSTLGSFVEDLAQAGRFSGVILVAKDDEIVFQKAYGKSNMELDIENTPETAFNIASMGKMFTGIAIAQLVEDHKLSYKDHLTKILPDLSRDIFKDITIKQLLTHTSGLGDIFNSPDFFSMKDTAKTIQSYVDLCRNNSLIFEPGSEFKYSNYGYILLGAIIEKVSGQSYYDYVKDHIFQPAGMSHTAFYEADKHNPHIAIGYASPMRSPGPTKIEMSQVFLRKSNKGMLEVKGTSAGGVFSTAPDLLKFSLALKNNLLISKKSFKTVSRGKVSVPKPPTPPGMKPLPDLKYAYGFGESYVNKQRIIGHNGGAPGVDVQMDIYPDLGYTVIVLSNYDMSVMPVVDYIQKIVTDS